MAWSASHGNNSAAGKPGAKEIRSGTRPASAPALRMADSSNCRAAAERKFSCSMRFVTIRPMSKRVLVCAVCVMFLGGIAASGQGITSKDLLAGFANPAQWLTYSGDYTGRRHSPLDADHPRERRAPRAAVDISNQCARQVRGDPAPHRWRALCDGLGQPRVGARRQNRPTDLALPARFTARRAGLLRPRQSRRGRARHAALHEHPGRASRGTRHEDRRGGLRCGDCQFSRRLRLHACSPRGQRQGDRRHRRRRVRYSRLPGCVRSDHR